jgi:undecaprenyl diphosphate synthase
MTDSLVRPKHVAVIMDGNNRWAKERGLPGVAGHKAGVDAVRAVVETSAREGVEVLSLFAFSSENWQRPKDEVDALMNLFLLALKREVKKLHKNNIRLRIVGDVSEFNDTLQKHINDAQVLTANNTGLTLVVAANYGGQWDIAQAAQALAKKVQAGELLPENIDAQLLGQHVSLADLPAPDLCIRTSGEQRMSNFMLWQLAYAEFYFTELYWPDFKRDAYIEALDAYSLRIRRFGKTDDQIKEG